MMRTVQSPLQDLTTTSCKLENFNQVGGSVTYANQVFCFRIVGEAN